MYCFSIQLILIFTFVINITYSNAQNILLDRDIILRHSVIAKDVSSILLQNGELTTALYTLLIPQLNCTSGCDLMYNLSQTVICKSIGWDGRRTIWECASDFPTTISFGNITMSCEGYVIDNNIYQLYGSCGLQYTLIENSKLESDYKLFNSTRTIYRDHISRKSVNYDSNTEMFFVTVLLLIGVCGCMYVISGCWPSDQYTSPSFYPNFKDSENTLLSTRINTPHKYNSLTMPRPEIPKIVSITPSVTSTRRRVTRQTTKH